MLERSGLEMVAHMHLLNCVLTYCRIEPLSIVCVRSLICTCMTKDLQVPVRTGWRGRWGRSTEGRLCCSAPAAPGSAFRCSNILFKPLEEGKEATALVIYLEIFYRICSAALFLVQPTPTPHIYANQCCGSGSGSRRAKMTHKSRKKIKVHVLKC